VSDEPPGLETLTRLLGDPKTPASAHGSTTAKSLRDDVIVGVIGGLVAVPLCDASWHAIVTEAEYTRGLAGLLVGLPVGIAGLTFHWWKDKVRWLHWIGAQSIYWLPAVIGMAFVYVAGPEIYRRAIQPATSTGQMASPPSALPQAQYLNSFRISSKNASDEHPIVVSGKFVVDVDDLAISVLWSDMNGQHRTPIGHSGPHSKDEEISINVVTATDVTNPNGSTLFWGDPKDGHPVPNQPLTQALPIFTCVILKGALGEQWFPLSLIRLFHFNGPADIIVNPQPQPIPCYPTQ
jgi:hypothetical protein